MLVKLSDLKAGSSALVKNIKTDDDIKRRLLDIGLIPNTKITSLYNSIFGNIKAYLIRESVIAIRENDAFNIEVELI